MKATLVSHVQCGLQYLRLGYRKKDAHHFLFQEQHFALQSLQVRRVVTTFAVHLMRRRRLLVLVVMFSSSKGPNETLRDFPTQFRLYILQVGQDAVVLAHCGLVRKITRFHCVRFGAGRGASSEIRAVICRGETRASYMHGGVDSNQKKKKKKVATSARSFTTSLNQLTESSVGSENTSLRFHRTAGTPTDLPFQASDQQ